jgi:outer membrane protein assembly factor BamA
MIDYDQTRIHQNVMKGILPNLSIGLGYAYDKHYNITVEESDYSSIIEGYMPEDKDYTISSGLTLPVMYDRRRNLLNPQFGFMASLTYSYYHPSLGSDDKWQSLFLETRKYFPFRSRLHKILAFRGYYWTIISGNPPYLDLPANRWEPVPGSASRGIRQNRYRSNALLYFESEYRFGITANGLLGGVVFASVTSASQYGTQQFRYWHPAAGTGIRLKFNKYSNTNVTCDFGFSKEFASVYVGIGEAF